MATSFNTNMGTQQLQSLINEFSLINSNIPNVTIEGMDAVYRKCLVKAVSGKRSVILNLTFPAGYPNGEAPVFQFSETSLDPSMEKKLLKVLKDTSLKHVQRNMVCLEPCLRNLISSLDSLTLEERRTPDSEVPFDLTSQTAVQAKSFNSKRFRTSYGNFQDSNIPFPRTSGASFCSAGYLVVYGRPADLKKSSTDVTPKALSDMVVYNQVHRMKAPQPQTPYVAMFSCSPPPATQMMEYPCTISNFYTYKEKRQRTRSRSKHVKDIPDVPRREPNNKSTKSKPKVGVVRVYDASNLLPIHRQLAEKYILDVNDVSNMCSANANAASAVGRKDLVQLWSLAAAMHVKTNNSHSREMFLESPWALCSLGRPLLESLLDHYCKIQDIQTVAMLCCMFWTRETIAKPKRSISKTSMDYSPANYNPYHTVSSVSNLLKGIKTTMVKGKRSNSWSDSYDDFRIFEEEIEQGVDQEQLQYEKDSKMLNPDKAGLYDQYKIAYANILYKWGLINQSALIMKFISFPVQPERNCDFLIKCSSCNQTTDTPQCTNNHIALKCSICRTGVKGASNFCLACGHGGHTKHILDWFEKETECPTGCGCNCLSKNPMIFGW